MLRIPLRLLVAGVLAAATAGCGPSDEGSGGAAATRPRILLLAVDGLDWGVMLPLVRSGRMPEIEALMEAGAYGLLRSARPTVCPRIWASVATGKTPDGHGIEGFTRWDPARPDRERLYRNTDRGAKALWDIFTDGGLRVHVVGWWSTFPVDRIAGVMVSRFDVASGSAAAGLGSVDGLVHPPERQDQMLDILGRAADAASWLRLDVVGTEGSGGSAQARDLLEASDWVLRSDAGHAAIALRLASEQPPYDLLAVYLAGADVLGHRFWRYFEPERFSHPPEPSDVAHYGRVIEAYYEFVDRVVGRLRRGGPEDATVIVLSDHGMSPSQTAAPFPAHARGRELRSAQHAHGPDGILVAAGPGVRPLRSPEGPREIVPSDLEVVGSVLDLTPTLLALVGIPAGEDMSGEVLTGLLTRDAIAGAPLERIPTHDSLEWLQTRLEREPTRLDETEYLARLRSLGCLE